MIIHNYSDYDSDLDYEKNNDYGNSLTALNKECELLHNDLGKTLGPPDSTVLKCMLKRLGNHDKKTADIQIKQTNWILPEQTSELTKKRQRTDDLSDTTSNN